MRRLAAWILGSSLALCACGGDDEALVAPKPGRPAAARDPEALLPETQPFAVAEPLPSAGPAEARGPSADRTRLVYSHVKASVRGGSVTTEVVDVVINDGSAPVDFSYRFPLPGDATVTSFAYFRDGKRVEARTREKADAKAGFAEAKSSGKAAALGEVDENARFSVSLSPLAPGESRRVELGYLQTLDAFGATRSYVFPAAHSERRGEPVLDLEVDLIAGARIERLESLNHPDARIVHAGAAQARVLLQRTGDALGQDLALRWSERAEPIELSLRAVAGEGGELGFGEVDFAFNADAFAEARPARDFVFVVDTSLSMAGEALVHAKLLVERAAGHLSERDRLALVTFDDSLSSWDAPLPATAAAKQRALAELAPKRAAGFSNVDAAIDRAAELVRGRERPVVLFVTDGQSTVGDALDELTPAASPKDFAHAQVFVALLNYPSRQPLLEKLFPGAVVRFVPGGKAGAELSQNLAELVSAPVLENVRLTIEGLAEDRRHGSLGDRLALGERIRVLGRLTAPTLRVKVSGTLHGRAVELEKSVGASDRDADRRMLPRAWARARMGDLERRYGETREDALRKEIVDLGTRYGLVSTLTSMLAVDSLSPDRVAPGDPELRVRAPRSLGGVHVELPWGESARCHFDEREGLWLGRFLVPRSTADGLYRARIFTEQQGRTALRGSLPFRVDSKAPRFRLRAERRGTQIELVAEPERDVFDKNGDSIRLDLVDVRDVVVRLIVGGGRPSGGPLDVGRGGRPSGGPLDVGRGGRPSGGPLDVGRGGRPSGGPLDVGRGGRPSGGPLDDERVSLARSGEREWSGSLPLPAPGRHALELVASDYAQNGSRLRAELDVPAAAERPLAVHEQVSSSLPVAPFGAGAPNAHTSESVAGGARALPAPRSAPRIDVQCLFEKSARRQHVVARAGQSVELFDGFLRVDGRLLTPCDGLPAAHPTAIAAFGQGYAVAFRSGGVHVVEDGRFRPLAGLPAGAEPGAAELRRLPTGRSRFDSVTAGTLPSAHVTAFAVHGGRLVVGTFAAGAFELDAGAEVRPIDGAPRFVNALLSDGDTLWFATARGLFRRRGGLVEGVPLPAHATHVNGLARGRDGTLWLATGGGVLGLRGGDWRSLDERQGLPSRIAYAVTESDDGALWVGTAAGVARVASEGVETFTLEDGRLPHRWVTALLADGDGVLTGTYAGGVTRLARGGARAMDALGPVWVNPHGLFRAEHRLFAANLGDGLVSVAADGSGRATTIGPLPSDDVTALAEFAGSLWVGTRGGIARLVSTARGE